MYYSLLCDQRVLTSETKNMFDGRLQLLLFEDCNHADPRIDRDNLPLDSIRILMGQIKSNQIKSIIK